MDKNFNFILAHKLSFFRIDIRFRFVQDPYCYLTHFQLWKNGMSSLNITYVVSNSYDKLINKILNLSFNFDRIINAFDHITYIIQSCIQKNVIKYLINLVFR